MKQTPNPRITATPLRQRAEAHLRSQRKVQASGDGDEKSAADTQRLLHQLQVHQVELELQNEELQTARNDMEAGLKKYSDLYDFAPVGYFTLNVEGAIHHVNLTGSSLAGIERSRLVGRSFGLLLVAEQRSVFNSFLEQVFAGQARQERDFAFLRQGKPPVPVNLKAQRSASGMDCRVVVMDLTERLEAEVASAKLAAIVTSSSDAIISKDLDGVVTSWNAGAERIFGYSASEMVGRPIARLIPSDRLREEAQILSRLRKGESVDGLETLRVAKNGRRLEVSITVSPIRFASGKIVGASKIARDITERRIVEKAQLRVAVLDASNRKLQKEILQRRAVEKSLKQSEQHQSRLLKESHKLQEELRQLARQVLDAQEDERRKISRELHDVIAQTLSGINLRLANLRTEAALKTKGLDRHFAHTQKLVEKSVNFVHEFARELRPAVLDDLGLIPALNAYAKLFSTRTRINVHIQASAPVEKLDLASRTVLYRVAQEALSNVARHAHATHVKVDIQKLPDCIRMKVEDNGKSFEPDRVLNATARGRLGLLGMRERLEMVGGRFDITAAKGEGTTVLAEIPFRKTPGRSQRPSQTKPALFGGN